MFIATNAVPSLGERSHPNPGNPYSLCDPQLAAAIASFYEEWEPFTVRSRRYPLIRLFRERIDPAWNDFCSRLPVNEQQLHAALACCDFGSGENEIDDHSIGKQIDLLHKLSDFATVYGFSGLEQVFCYLSGLFQGPVRWNFVMLEDLADSCTQKYDSKKLTADDAFRVDYGDLAPFCRFCGRKAEVWSYVDGQISLPKDADDKSKNQHWRLSPRFCSEHRPRVAISQATNARYRTAKRNATKFDQELGRIATQRLFWDEAVPRAESGNDLVDEFVFRLVQARQLLVDDSDDPEWYDAQERALARALVDSNISDRKKEILALSANGLSQSSVAKQLGISQQAVSKALKSIPSNYRSDIRRPSRPWDFDNGRKSTRPDK